MTGMGWDFLRRHAWWLIPLLIFDIFFFRWWWQTRTPEKAMPEGAVMEQAGIPTGPPVLLFGFPTDQTNLWDTTSEGVFQPTASGRVESALYGSTRTRSFGGTLLPAFHMGIDIAALGRDGRGRPLDEVYAVTDGEVVYINRVAGNSTYGIYVVLVHADPLGDIYTLYSHLARVQEDVQAGDFVERGAVLGIMGNTASTGIPMARAHLHFEIGVINNARFHSWYRDQRLIPDHGMWHGHNLTGIDPLAVFGNPAAPNPVAFSMKEYLRQAPPAFSLVVRAERPLDYFKRYPALWTGPPFVPGAVVLTATEGGVIREGRLATEEEDALLGREHAVVLSADADVLGRNGRRLVQSRGGQWVVGRNGERWLEILLY